MKLILIFFIIINLFAEEDLSRIPKEFDTEKKEPARKIFTKQKKRYCFIRFNL